MSEDKKVTIEVVDIQEAGTCNFGHKVGDKFSYPEDRGNICSAAFHVIYPYAMAIRMGASFPWEEESETVTICCPDYKNPVVFKITKE
ncbi:MAG: TIGR04076 family protein [Candidatus Heimdallarchaeota archaeon]|nr:TIGR04076 family protein [Candidatus Heimdallarchaeota archaeon]